MKTNLISLQVVALHCVFIAGMGARLSQAQDQFFGCPFITGSNIVVSISTVGATKEPGEPYHAGNRGGASVWWSWTAPASDQVTISTAGSSFDTLLAVYTGQYRDELTLIVGNDDAPDAPDFSSKVSFNALSNQTYRIAVDGYDGAVGTARLQLRSGPALPLPFPAPPWSALPDAYGQALNPGDFAGKVILLNFWATTSGFCKDEIPDLAALQEKYRADGLAIVGADLSGTGDTPQKLTNFLATAAPPLNFPVVMSTAAAEQAFGGIDSLPTTFLIDRQNTIRHREAGVRSLAQTEREIIPLLYTNLRLDAQASGDQLMLSWPITALAFSLESSTSLQSRDWLAWPEAPTVADGTNRVRVPLSGQPLYFRLHLPY